MKNGFLPLGQFERTEAQIFEAIIRVAERFAGLLSKHDSQFQHLPPIAFRRLSPIKYVIKTGPQTIGQVELQEERLCYCVEPEFYGLLSYVLNPQPIDRRN